jgi:xylan 1,4-beta-xylosidase
VIAPGSRGASETATASYVRMNVGNQLRAIANGFSIVAAAPELKNAPIVIGESDPEVARRVRCGRIRPARIATARCSRATPPNNSRTYELADLHKVNLAGAVSWAFEFEGQPYFDGFRDLATNGIDKPVLNIFRMLGKMSGNRVASTSTGARTLDEVRIAACADPPISRRSPRATRAAPRSSCGTITMTICPRRQRPSK